MKDKLRKISLEKRDNLNTDEKKQFDKGIFKLVTESDLFKNAQVIFAFVSFKSEVDTFNIINHALTLGKTVCVPKVISKEEGLKVYKIESLQNLITSNYGILEPTEGAKEIMPQNIDLVLTPGLAFDLNGGRLGYGAGYYDRFLRNPYFKGIKIGICYSTQIVDKVPTNEDDIFMDIIITELYYINAKNRRNKIGEKE